MTNLNKKKQINRREFLSLGTIGTIGLFASSQMFLTFSSCKDKKQKLRLQLPWINDAEFIGYFIAIENGYYKDEGIEFDYLPGGPEIVSDSVLLVSHAEIALTTPDVTISAISKQKAPFKIIGTQYQKSPLGIVSLEKNEIKTPNNLIGKTLAVPPANQLTIDAFLKINNINKNEVHIVPYQYDPAPLLNGEVDATLDFVTNVPFTIKERGGNPTSFLLYDYGFKIFNDTVVVREEYLEKNRDLLSAWIRASKRGWEENFKDTTKYPQIFSKTYFNGTGRSVENEVFYNHAQQELIQSVNGIFSMSEASINDNIESLKAVGVEATKSMFVTDLQ